MYYFNIPIEPRPALVSQEEKNAALVARMEPCLRALGDRIEEMGVYALVEATGVRFPTMQRVLKILENDGRIRPVRRPRKGYVWLD